MARWRPPLRGRAHKVAVNAALDFYNVPADMRNVVKPKRAPSKGRDYGPSEHQVQVGVIDWWAFACKDYGLPVFALFAVPSGGARDVITGKRLKDEGVRRGVPDLILAAPRGLHHGCFIEMKLPGNKPSEEQAAFMRYLERAGYRCAVCWSTESAIREIKFYLSLREDDEAAPQMGPAA